MSDNTVSRQASRQGAAAGSSQESRQSGDYLVEQIRISSSKLQLAIPPAELCSKLRQAVELAASRDADSMEKLRSAVCEYTALLRDRGTSPEGVLVSLKAVININALPPVAPDPADHARYKLRESISTWAIEEYFKGAY